MYATVEMKPGVAILPINSEQIVYLSRQFRYAIGQESIEVVCGSIEEDESPLEAAKREIEEELGIQAGEWIELGVFHLDTSIVHCPVYLFLVKQLTFIGANQEGTEAIERLRIPFDEAVQMVMYSQIAHGPSCVLILKAYKSLTQS
jgi:8-oxo-dGTP pyrophosphatase MutT (NUDIX family)